MFVPRRLFNLFSQVLANFSYLLCSTSCPIPRLKKCQRCFEKGKTANLSSNWYFSGPRFANAFCGWCTCFMFTDFIPRTLGMAEYEFIIALCLEEFCFYKSSILVLLSVLVTSAECIFTNIWIRTPVSYLLQCMKSQVTKPVEFMFLKLAFPMQIEEQSCIEKSVIPCMYESVSLSVGVLFLCWFVQGWRVKRNS